MKCKGKHGAEPDDKQTRCEHGGCKFKKPADHKVCEACSRKLGICQVCAKPLTASAVAMDA
jgi:hypothetical protein